MTVTDRSVAATGDLSTDLGQAGEAGDAATLTFQFDYISNGSALAGPQVEELFKIVIVSEELPEHGGSLADDIVSVTVNGSAGVLLSDGRQMTLQTLALSPDGPFHPDLNLNLVGEGALEDVLRADAYTEVLRVAGPVLSGLGPFPATNTITFEVVDRGNGLLDAAIFIAPIVFNDVLGSSESEPMMGTVHDYLFFA